jgi:triosephosphate isomerase
MNPVTKKDAQKIFSEIKKAEVLSKKLKINLDFIVAPPSIYLDRLSEKNKKKTIKLSGQDIFHKNYGAYTGSISNEMLKDLGSEYSIIGH